MLHLFGQYSWFQELHFLIFPIHPTSYLILLHQVAFVPQTGFAQPKKQFLPVAHDSPLLPLFFLPEKLPSFCSVFLLPG